VRTLRGSIEYSVLLLLICGGAAGLALLVSSDPLVERAVMVSATLAAVAQLAGFACARYLLGRNMNLFAGWAAAMVVRFASLAIYALVVFKAPQYALVPAPALVSFAALLLATSIPEPLFLNR
jgi:hypothetical protein